MKAIVIRILFFMLFLCIPTVMFGKEVSPKLVYLTFQSDNGSFRQVTELDGTITIYLKQLDVIKVNMILLNGSDVTFGLEKRDRIDHVVVDWPSGRTEEFKNLNAGRCYECTEGKGIVPQDGY